MPAAFLAVIRTTAKWGSYVVARTRPVRVRLTRVLLVLELLVGFLLAVLAIAPGTATPAAAAPGDRPVRIVIDSISPKVAGPDGPIVVTGLLINNSDTAITDLTMRLQRGPVQETRTQLADYDASPAEVNDESTAFVDLDRPLPASGELRFSYPTTTEELGLSANGAYPLLVNLNGRADGAPASRVGEQVILLPYVAQPPTATTELSWLWPLVARPERNAAGTFTGTDLMTSLRQGGRLDRALSAIEGTPSPDGSNSPPAPVTLVVDPELLDAVRVLAAGDYAVLVAGQQQASSASSADATSWLARLGALAAGLPVLALPYADPDIGALIGQGQAEAVERRLPDGEAGDLVTQILGVAPISTIAWPPDGSASDPAVLGLLQAHGVRQVVADERLTFVERSQATTLNAVSTIRAPSGPMTALVGDHVLSQLVQADVDTPGDLALTEQRFLAELVAIADEAPTQGRHLLIAPRRDFEPQTARALMDAAARQPWLGRGMATDLDEAVPTPAERRTLDAGPATDAIPAAQLAELLTAMRARDAFASALTDPDSDLLAIDRALARAGTINRSAAPEPGLAAVRDVAAAVAGLSATVGIIPPVNGTYSLASADAPLVLTVFNNNPFPVAVTVALAPRGAPGVTTTNVEQVLPAQTRTTIAVPANVQRSGSFTMLATVSTPAGSPLGPVVALRVQSTVYGPVALAITFGAGALLLLLFARRSLRYWQRRRGNGQSGPRETAAAGAAAAGSGHAQPIQTQPIPTQPIQTQPIPTQPIQTQPGDPLLVEPPRRSPV